MRCRLDACASAFATLGRAAPAPVAAALPASCFSTAGGAADAAATAGFCSAAPDAASGASCLAGAAPSFGAARLASGAGRRPTAASRLRCRPSMYWRGSVCKQCIACRMSSLRHDWVCVCVPLALQAISSLFTDVCPEDRIFNDISPRFHCSQGLPPTQCARCHFAISTLLVRAL